MQGALKRWRGAKSPHLEDSAGLAVRGGCGEERKEVGRGTMASRGKFPVLPPLESDISRSEMGLGVCSFKNLWFTL